MSFYFFSQTSPVKYVNEGETPLRFLRLLDEPEGPRVKVALYGNDAMKDFSVGEVISLTETYRYKDTNTLSTKKTCKLEVCFFSAYPNLYKYSKIPDTNGTITLKLTIFKQHLLVK